MFIANNKGQLQAFSGFNSNAEPQFGPAKTVACGVVHLNKQVQKSTVRADSSGSRGAADEFVSTTKILFPKTVSIATGYRFRIAGFTLKAIAVEPRYSVHGKLDHYEVDFEQWT